MPRVKSLLAAFALSSILLAQVPFTQGNLVVVRVGTGVAALTSAAQATFLDEYTTAGVLVQTVAMPTALSGSNLACTNAGTATSEGSLNISADSRFFTLAGYSAAPGTLAIAGTTSVAVPRVIARVGSDGVINTSTSINNVFSAGTMRSAVTDNGNQFFACGSNSGVQFATLGGTTSAAASSALPTNLRCLGIYQSQLYCSSASGTYLGVSSVGVGLPTTAQPITILPGFPTTTGPSSYDFFFADSTTCYVADDRVSASGGGIQKWVLSGSTWALAYTLAPLATSTRYLSGTVIGGVVTLYATSTVATGNAILSVVDAGVGSPFTTVATTLANTALRGIRVLAARAAVSFSGTGSPTTVGIPTVGTTGGLPYLGNSAFTLTAGNMPAFNIGFMAIGLGLVQSVGIPLPGAPASFNLYVNPIANTVLLITDALGNATLPLGLPSASAMAGLPLAVQVISYDGLMLDPLPLGASIAMQILLGQW